MRSGSLIALVLVASVVVSMVSLSRTQREIETAYDVHGSDYVGSAACTRCHPGHESSWHRTFHRTMTQTATRESILPPFEGESLRYAGVTMRAFRDEGRFTIEYASRRYPVERVVGSRRIQQFLTRRGSSYWRLPVAWHIEEARWISMNETFLTSDPAGFDEGTIALEDYERHVTRWNDNCIFCHNVDPNPNRNPTGEFDSRVAELGVGCEACHGPGSEHVERNTDPMRRYWLHSSESADPTIVNPSRLSAERSSDSCGKCHGQRMSDDIDSILAHGDPFVPGDDLALYSSPLWIDTTVNDEEGHFELRFYSDGTPRLTAYEYQGLLQSRCHIEGDLDCTDCHSMHRSDPEGQLRYDRPGDRLCTSECHVELESDSARRAHSEHDDVRCVDCHMPRIVYGIQTIHRSHRIDIPRQTDAEYGDRPDACSLCHLDRSERWTWALSGDPIVRAVMTYHLGRTATPEPEFERAETQSARAELDRARRIGLLLTIYRDDPYSAIRTLARRSLGQLDIPLPPEASAESIQGRRARVEAIRRRNEVEFPDSDRTRVLEDRAGTMAIQIGE